jgi:tubulin beta
MGEIVTLHIGGCGVSLAEIFWSKLSQEHGIDLAGRGLSGNPRFGSDGTPEAAFFSQTMSGKFRARAVFATMSGGAIAALRKSPVAGLFDDTAFIAGKRSAQAIWGKGFYTEGPALLDRIMDRVRYEVNDCMSMDGFLIVHALDGGCGGGLSSLLAIASKREFPNIPLATFSVFQCRRLSDRHLSDYNTALSLNRLSETADAVFCLDSDDAYSLAQRLYRKAPDFPEVNAILGEVMNAVTSPLRSRTATVAPISQDELRRLQRRGEAPPVPTLHPPANRCSTLRFMVGTLVPSALPKLRFLTTAISAVGPQAIDLFANSQPRYSSLLHVNNRTLGSVREEDGHRSIAAAAIFRGPRRADSLSEFEATAARSPEFELRPPAVVELQELPAGSTPPMALIRNESAVLQSFERVFSGFEAVFERKAFLHFYTSEGMDEQEFVDAGNKLQSLIEGYRALESPVTDEPAAESPAGSENPE